MIIEESCMIIEESCMIILKTCLYAGKVMGLCIQRAYLEMYSYNRDRLGGDFFMLEEFLKW
ncbi:hypothetical protein SAMN05443252_10335 [Bacillus sp. OV322]|nr:hypothetical protein SAMN05443252_10335 [Bacillus sp. OV322]